MNALIDFLSTNTISFAAVAGSELLTSVSQSLGVSGGAQGFLLYLLIMVGIFIIISILIYNWWEERRFHKQVDSNFSSIEEDALLDDDKQAFLDKFASTTGVLNDTPPSDVFIDEELPEVEDDRSIEEVYAELLETMSNRNEKEDKVEPTGLTIDHQTIDVTPEPAFEVPKTSFNAPENNDEILHIPEALVTDSNLSNAAQEDITTVSFTDSTTSSEFVDLSDTPTVGHIESASQVEIPDEQSQAEADMPVASEDNVVEEERQSSEEIRDIISQAFKAKYNPNYNADEEVTEEDSQPVATTGMPTSEEDVGVDEVAEKVNDIKDDAAPMEAINEETVESESDVTTDSGEFDLVIDDEIPAADPEPLSAAEAVYSPDLDFDLLKGLGDDVVEPSNTEAVDTATNQSPAVETPLPSNETITQPAESPSQTYQQLLATEEPENFAENKLDEAPLSSAAAQPSTNNTEEEPTQNAPENSEEIAETPSAFSDELPALLNQHIDYIGTIEVAKGPNAALILDSFSGLHRQYEQPVYVLMQSTQSQWLLLNDATESDIAKYLNKDIPLQIIASLQMADRSGAVSRNTIQRFQQSLSEIAVTMGSQVKWVDLLDPADRAASLDAFCIEVDKTMFFHLANTKTPFTGTKLKGLLEGQGMRLENDGAFKYYNLNSSQSKTSPDFVLFNRENHPFNDEMLRTSVIKAITLQLDIPHVQSQGNALDTMVVIAKGLETSLNTQLVDDKNRPITDMHLAQIRDQIKSIHAAMQLRGITPGSAHAQRLFA